MTSSTIMPVPTIDANGITLPSYNDVHAGLRQIFRNIYGQDIYIEPDSQDGQLIAILALAFHDSFSIAEAVYQAFSPSTAQGVGLSRVVKINGIRRHVPTSSTADVKIVGQVGTVIVNGIAGDDAGNRWVLPDEVVIPYSGEIIVTAIAADLGAIQGGANTITSIITPTLGWQSVTNTGAIVPGAAVETDAQLRRRQAVSTMLPSSTVLEGIVGAIAAVIGVVRYAGFENDTDSTDTNGIPPHTVAFVVEGGSTHEIAQAIHDKKTPGSGTYGTTSETITDAYGIPHVIRFYRRTDVPIRINITLKAFANYTSVIENKIKDAILAWIDDLPIDEDVILSRLYVPANLNGTSLLDSNTYDITAITMGRVSGGAPTAADIPLAFNEKATLARSNIVITVI